MTLCLWEEQDRCSSQRDHTTSMRRLFVALCFIGLVSSLPQTGPSVRVERSHCEHEHELAHQQEDMESFLDLDFLDLLSALDDSEELEGDDDYGDSDESEGYLELLINSGEDSEESPAHALPAPDSDRAQTHAA